MGGVVGVVAIGLDKVQVKKSVEPRRRLRRIRGSGDNLGHPIINDETNSFYLLYFHITNLRLSSYYFHRDASCLLLHVGIFAPLNKALVLPLNPLEAADRHVIIFRSRHFLQHGWSIAWRSYLC